MGLELTEMKCDCKVKKPGHDGWHDFCCACIKCNTCGWIQEKHFVRHKKLCPGENPVATKQEPVVPKTKEPDPVLDSLDISISSMDDLGIEMAEELQLSDFRATVREALEEVLEHHAFFTEAVPFPTLTRAEKWSYLLEIIFSKRLSDDKIIAKLVALFPGDKRDDDLELKLWQMLAERDELFPAHAHSHS